MIKKSDFKKLLGEAPFAAELYWRLRQNGKPVSESFSLRRTEKRLPAWLEAVNASPYLAEPGKRVLIFAALRYWIEHAALLGLALAGLGHQATLAFLPYPNWRKALNRFDVRRHNLYARHVLEQAAPRMQVVSFLDVRAERLSEVLNEAVRQVSRRDVQYTLQMEAVDETSELFRLRQERNRQAAGAALTWLRAHPADVLLTPNGSILEMGAVYQAARSVELPIVTYEFGEQRGRIWLARDGEVMRQETGELWQARQNLPLTQAQWQQAQDLFASRQRADLWQNFSRRWQGAPSQGGQRARAALGLDDRPVALLAANVIGDSLTLGRQIFTESMTEWLQETVHHFALRPQTQLVVRIHPGERYTQGPSVADVVRQALPNLPEHVHLVPADAPVNTYDLIAIADLGLVYTTTVGMEMAMSGAPVVVAGETHYRGKGFTLDPDSWKAYYQMVDSVLQDPAAHRLSQAQAERAWNYAYRFFFDYPRPFPWHLLHFWNELEEWPLERALSAEGQAQFGDTFRALVGEVGREAGRHVDRETSRQVDR